MPYGNQDVVILACAVSAGIHAALAPDHFREATGAGLGFVVATVLLAALAVAVTFWPDHLHAPKLAALVFTGLVVSYGLAITTGVPALHPDVEPVDGLALFTKAVEIAGLLASLSLLTSIERSSTWASQLLRARSLSH
jgi:hypothetical protein